MTLPRFLLTPFKKLTNTSQPASTIRPMLAAIPSSTPITICIPYVTSCGIPLANSAANANIMSIPA